MPHRNKYRVYSDQKRQLTIGEPLNKTAVLCKAVLVCRTRTNWLLPIPNRSGSEMYIDIQDIDMCAICVAACIIHTLQRPTRDGKSNALLAELVCCMSIWAYGCRLVITTDIYFVSHNWADTKREFAYNGLYELVPTSLQRVTDGSYHIAVRTYVGWVIPGIGISALWCFFAARANLQDCEDDVLHTQLGHTWSGSDKLRIKYSCCT